MKLIGEDEKLSYILARYGLLKKENRFLPTIKQEALVYKLSDSGLRFLNKLELEKIRESENND